jgi:hypothetical protein
MNNNIEEIKALGKTAIIQLSSIILENECPQLNIRSSDFKITVWASKKEILVKYKRLIRYVPLNKEENNYIYDFSVNVISQKVPQVEFLGMDSLFIPTKEDLKNIEFVKKSFGLPYQGFDNTIYEKEDAYHICVDNDVAFGKYFIDKISGKETMAPMQGSYAPMPIPPRSKDETDSDPLIEIVK